MLSLYPLLFVHSPFCSLPLCFTWRSTLAALLPLVCLPQLQIYKKASPWKKHDESSVLIAYLLCCSGEDYETDASRKFVVTEDMQREQRAVSLPTFCPAYPLAYPLTHLSSSSHE